MLFASTIIQDHTLIIQQMCDYGPWLSSDFTDETPSRPVQAGRGSAFAVSGGLRKEDLSCLFELSMT